MDCVICKKPEITQKHHLVYEPEITIDVCIPCHIILHNHGVGGVGNHNIARRQIQYNDIWHQKERERQKRFRDKHKDALKIPSSLTRIVQNEPIISPPVPQFDDPSHHTITSIKNQPIVKAAIKLVGRKKQYDDIFHSKERDRVQRFRTLNKGVLDGKLPVELTVITKEQHSIFKTKEIIVEPGRIAQMIQSKICSKCMSKECNGIEPCEEYKRLYEYEKMKQTIKQ